MCVAGQSAGVSEQRWQVGRLLHREVVLRGARDRR